MPSKLLVRRAAWLVVLSAAGCGTDGISPPPPAPTSTTTLGEAYRDAELVSGKAPGRATTLGRGDSMAPVYGDNTLVVINPIRFEDLKPGMTVAYVNRRGMRVVHTLVEKTKEGWLVAGLNNNRIDDEAVTPANLLGVVYSKFYYTDEKPGEKPASK